MAIHKPTIGYATLTLHVLYCIVLLFVPNEHPVAVLLLLGCPVGPRTIKSFDEYRTSIVIP